MVADGHEAQAVAHFRVAMGCCGSKDDPGPEFTTSKAGSPGSVTGASGPGRTSEEQSGLGRLLPGGGRRVPPTLEEARNMDEMQAVMHEVAGIRRSGSAALDLAYVAAGRFDGYWERNLQPWDLAAGVVLVREAGGVIMDCDGGNAYMDKCDVLAGNAAIVKAVAPHLA